MAGIDLEHFQKHSIQNPLDKHNDKDQFVGRF